MSGNSQIRRWTGGVGMAVGASFAAAVLGLVPAARADIEPGIDPFEDLFGVAGINSWTSSADSFLVGSDPSLAASLDTSVDNFLATVPVTLENLANFPEGDAPFSYLVYDFDPSAFGPDAYYGPLLDGALPTNAIGDFAVGLDYTMFATGIAGNEVGIADLLTSIENIPALVAGWGFLLDLIFAG